MADSLKVQITDKLCSPDPANSESALLAHLKSRILSNALALYGAPSSSPTPSFDIITYTIPLPPALQVLLDGRSGIPSILYGAALITYTSPRECTSWERLATAENSGGVVAAMQELLADIEAGVGRVMCKSGGYAVSAIVVRGPRLMGGGSAVGCGERERHRWCVGRGYRASTIKWSLT